jgi:FkbM family methyltransferase
MYSQEQEEKIIVDYFGDHRGRFLDVGAHDGKDISNTYRLAELGWEGICVEPSWKVIGNILANHKNHAKVKILNGAMSDVAGIVPFWVSEANVYSTMDPALQARGGERNGAAEIFVPTFTTQSLLAAFPGNFDFVNIDAEGLSVRILLTMPLLEMGTRLICVERFGEGIRLGDERKIREYLDPLGYREVYSNFENMIMGL